MTKKVVVVEAGATVREAVEVLNKNNCGSVVVLQNGTPVGIITERDILKRVIPTCQDTGKMEVQNIMSAPLVVGQPQMELIEAARIMLEKKLRTSQWFIRRSFWVLLLYRILSGLRIQ